MPRMPKLMGVAETIKGGEKGGKVFQGEETACKGKRHVIRNPWVTLSEALALQRGTADEARLGLGEKGSELHFKEFDFVVNIWHNKYINYGILILLVYGRDDLGHS